MDIRHFFKKGAASGGGGPGKSITQKPSKDTVKAQKKSTVKSSKIKDEESVSTDDEIVVVNNKGRTGKSTASTGKGKAPTKANDKSKQIKDEESVTTDDEVFVVKNKGRATKSRAPTGKGKSPAMVNVKSKQIKDDESVTTDDDLVQMDNKSNSIPARTKISKGHTDMKTSIGETSKLKETKEIKMSADDFFAAAMGTTSKAALKDPKELAKQKLREQMAKDEAELQDSPALQKRSAKTTRKALENNTEDSEDDSVDEKKNCTKTRKSPPAIKGNRSNSKTQTKKTVLRDSEDEAESVQSTNEDESAFDPEGSMEDHDQEDDFFEDDDDDDDEEEFVKKKKTPAKKAAKKEIMKQISSPGVRRSPRKKTTEKQSHAFDDKDEEESPPPYSRKRKAPKKEEVSDDEESPTCKSNQHTPPKRTKTKTSGTKKATHAKKGKAPMPEDPLEEGKVITLDDIKSKGGCLDGYTFVFTGVLPSLGREESMDYVKSLGGRVTSAISGKTDYLVCGMVLEDDRPYVEGSKYKKATEMFSEKCNVLVGEQWFYALIKMLDDNKAKEEAPDTNLTQETSDSQSAKSLVTNPYAKKATGAVAPAPVSNPYIKKPIINPYAKSTAASVNPHTKISSESDSIAMKDHFEIKTSHDKMRLGENSLWADKYAPRRSDEILGNGEAVRKLRRWLDDWERTFNNSQARGKSYSAPNGPWKAALLSGPPGIGKSTTAMLVSKEAGRDVLELNASDTRSKKSLRESLGDVTGSQVLSFGDHGNGRKSKKASVKQMRCIIMDEVDGMGAGDRSGMAELIQMIKHSMVPIICICNDRQSQKMKSLVPYCMDLRYRRPVKSVIGKRAVEVGGMEGMRVESNAAEAIAESCGNDIRQVLNVLQMWSTKKKTGGGGRSSDITYRELKEREHEINKDDMLRVSMFDATKLIVEGPRGVTPGDIKSAKNSFFKRTDAFFVDYNFVGLNIHQNYLKVMVGQMNDTKRSRDADGELKLLERMADATQSMSDFGMVEQKVRGGDMNWALLPFCSVLAVKTGFHAGGERGGFLPGFPEFTGWLGKNSSRGKMKRLLQELHHHMNYKVSGDATEIRLRYLPVLRKQFMQLLKDKEGPRTTEVIEMMDEYGLDRDDLFENLDLFTLESKPSKFTDLDSKTKAAFTREYNKVAHKSQALVAEQGMTKGSKRKAASSEPKEAQDLDAVDDDAAQSEEIEEDEDVDAEKVRQMFQKKTKAAAKRKSSNGVDAKKTTIKKKK